MAWVSKGQTTKAIEGLRQLSQAYPEQPVLHNNLGVLYATQGQLEEARKAFESGLNAQPEISLLYRNLDQLRRQISRDAFVRAIEINKPASVPVQLTLWPAEPEPKPKTLPKGVDKPEPQPMAKTPAQPLNQAPAGADELKQAVLAWAHHWSNKDVGRYFEAYSLRFTPNAKLSRSDWEAERKARILSKKTIHVELKDIHIDMHERGAQVQFQQIYESDSYARTSRKTMAWVKEGERWLILRESVN